MDCFVDIEDGGLVVEENEGEEVGDEKRNKMKIRGHNCEHHHLEIMKYLIIEFMGPADLLKFQPLRRMNRHENFAFGFRRHKFYLLLVPHKRGCRAPISPQNFCFNTGIAGS